MNKSVELRRHTANDGDFLTPEGIETALEVGKRLDGGYHLLISSGAQRATQTLACFLAVLGERIDSGVTVDLRFRSEFEEKWFEAYNKAGSGDLEAFLRADPELVESEARCFGDALRDVFDSLPSEGRALVVGHSPMHEVAVYGLTGEIVPPIGKGAGVRIIAEADGYKIERVS